jgi:hypothetical protein
MSKKILSPALLSFVLLWSLLCSTGCYARGRPGLLIPVGRLARDGNQVSLSIDAKPFTPETVGDGCGGYWFKIPFDALDGKSRVTVAITRTTADTRFHEQNADPKRWTAPSALIDSDNPDIKRKAGELTAGCRGNDDKAEKILQYAVKGVAFRPYAFMHYSPASATLRNGFGVCVNHSRLFVALCRAAGVPARTVSGAMPNESHNYSHHEWVEYYDDAGAWRALEPSFSTDMHFTDLRHFGLIYDIESNPVYPFDRGWEQDRVELPNGDRSIFCPDWGVQRGTGEMSSSIVKDSFPDPVEISMSFDLSKYVDR